MTPGPTNESLLELVRRQRRESAADHLRATVLDLAPGETLEVTRNADDAPAQYTVARYSVRQDPDG